ncbi:MAG: 3-dehydroquinate synthase [Rhizobiales bacterium]|nr:3-dehydroquinate synthase [Hyphomicrobiales bacterium]
MADAQEARVEAKAERVVEVALGDRSYQILIGSGLLARAGEAIATTLPRARIAIVTDENVAGAQLAAARAGLAPTCQCLGEVVLPAGEATKSFESYTALSRRLLQIGVERGDALVALGGGVIGDLAGFAAATLRRGVAFVQVPTSLLAQVDSSVGGKTGINAPEGKNLIGAFHQPSLVLIDIDTLATLDSRQLRAGYAEVAKYGLIGRPDFFAWLEANAPRLIAGDAEARRHAIEVSVRAKAEVVAADERESGERALLNLGHTFGHALEAHAGFTDLLLHGEAIAIGMAQAARYSERRGLIGAGERERIERHFIATGLPTRIGDVAWRTSPTPERLLELMGQDKKVARGRLVLILLAGIGSAFIERSVDEGDLSAFLDQECRI